MASTTQRARKPRPVKKRPEKSLRAKIRKLTPSKADLLRYAAQHPTPPEFWNETQPAPPVDS